MNEPIRPTAEQLIQALRQALEEAWKEGYSTGHSDGGHQSPEYCGMDKGEDDSAWIESGTFKLLP